MTIYLAADHAGWHRKEAIRHFLEHQNEISVEIIDLSIEYDELDNYPEVAKKIADSLLQCNKSGFENTCFGIAFCGTGQGICMALNRFPFIRAGVSLDIETVRLLRFHNRANVLCLPGRFGTNEECINAITTFLSTNIDTTKRHADRVKMLSNMEYNKGTSIT